MSLLTHSPSNWFAKAAMFKTTPAQRLPGKRELIAAIVAGITGGWFLVFFGANIPRLFGFQPVVTPGELVIIFAFFGVSFGYHLGKAMTQTSASFIFVGTFFGYIVVSMLVDWRPIFFGGTPSEYAAVVAVPAIFIVALYVAQILPRGKGADRFIAIAGTLLSWPLFWFHIGYVYIYPLFLNLLNSPTDAGRLVNFAILTAVWVLVIPAAYYTLGKSLRQDLKS